jgi:Tfp pilus assembly protein PilX
MGPRSAGFAMAVVLVLIAIMALLSVSAVQDALTSRTLATTRLYHQRAFEMAELGAAGAMAELRTGAMPSAMPRQMHPAPSPTDSAVVTVSSVATNSLPTGFSAGRFVGHHYEISSTGLSARNARVVQVQGLRRIEPVMADDPRP